MGKLFVLSIFLVCLCFAKEDYSEMSTQELIAIMGYVKENNKKEYLKELNSRVSTMSEKEREMYEKNKENMQNDEN